MLGLASLRRKVEVRAGTRHPQPPDREGPGLSPWWAWELWQATLQWGWRLSPCSLLSCKVVLGLQTKFMTEGAARTWEQVGHPWLLRSVNVTCVSCCNSPHGMRRGSTPHFLPERSQTQDPRPPRLHRLRRSGGSRLCFLGRHRYPSGRCCCASVVRSLQRLNTHRVPTFHLLITEQTELGPPSASAVWAPVPRAAEQIGGRGHLSPIGPPSPPSPHQGDHRSRLSHTTSEHCPALAQEARGSGMSTGFLRPLPASGSSWHSLARGHITPISASVFTQLPSLCPCFLLSYTDALGELQTHPNPGSSHLHPYLHFTCRDPISK